MSLVKAKEYLKKYNMDDRIMEFDVSSATVKEAALALNCKEERIAKTLSFLVGDDPILIVVAGDQKVDNHKYKEFFHTKAKMIPYEDVNKIIGHEIGGVCPFGINPNIDVYLDVSLKRFETVFPACGSHNSAIELNLEELEKTSNCKEWIDVCKNIEN